MVDFNLINSLTDYDDDAGTAVMDALGESYEDLGKLIPGKEVTVFNPGSIITGRISGLAGDDWVVELGLKSEGILERGEFDEPELVKIGDEVKVLLEDVEGDTGLVKISKRKADRIINWEAIMKTKKEGEPVSGKVTKKIKGGLLVDIGVPVFLPASQVDIRRPGEISDWIGRNDRRADPEDRRGAAEHRHQPPEDDRVQQRDQMKKETMERLQVGAGPSRGRSRTSPTSARSSTSAGSTACSTSPTCRWGRINHPSELLKIDQEIEVKVLQIDKDKEKIALGLKQKDASAPGRTSRRKYPVGSVHEAERRQHHVATGPSASSRRASRGWCTSPRCPGRSGSTTRAELVARRTRPVGVKILEINKDKQEISLGMKQVEENPWERVAEKYPPGSVVRGQGAEHRQLRGVRGDRGGHRRPAARVRFVVDEEDRAPVSEVLKKSEDIEAVVLNGRPGQAADRPGPQADAARTPGTTVIPTATTAPGMVVKGHVTKIANFGVFVELAPGLEGLLHISEISDQKVEKPEDILKIGQELDVKILRVDSDERKIGLSLKRAQWQQEEIQREETRATRPEKKNLKGGLEGGESTIGLGDLKLGQ